MDLPELLVQSGVLKSSALPGIAAEMQKPGATAESVLTTTGGLTMADILKAKGSYYNVPTREVGEKPVPFDILRYIPEESARHYHFVPLAVQDGVLEVGITDPDNLEARDALTFISAKIGMPYKLFLISDTDFEHLLTQYKGLSGEVGKALGELETEFAVEATEDKARGAKPASLTEENQITETESEATMQDAPVTKIVA